MVRTIVEEDDYTEPEVIHTHSRVIHKPRRVHHVHHLHHARHRGWGWGSRWGSGWGGWGSRWGGWGW